MAEAIKKQFRTTKAGLKALIDETERRYEECWQILAEFKNLKSDQVPKELFDFQLLLCEALIELDDGYRKLHREKKRLVRNKTSYSAKWFKKRMACLSHYQKVIQQAIKIGKSMGDSFAWFFYQNERDFIIEHLKNQEQRHLPPGLGVLGEKEFIRNVKHIDKKLVIYHGTTTFLRIGDFSLIDLIKLELVALGEIKTARKDENTLSLNVTFIGSSSKSLDFGVKETKKIKKFESLSPKQKDRYNRQIECMGETISKVEEKNIAGKMDLISQNSAKDVADVVQQTSRGKFRFKKISESMVIAPYRQCGQSLFGNLISKGEVGDKLKGVEKEVRKIVKSNSKNNYFYVSSLFYSEHEGPNYLYGTLPLFWWPIDLEVIKSIIFREVVITSIHNTAHLIDRLEKNGYKVIINPPGEYTLEKSYGKSAMRFEGFYYFVQIMQLGLIPEDTIIRIVEKAEKETRKLSKEKGCDIRMEISFSQRM